MDEDDFDEGFVDIGDGVRIRWTSYGGHERAGLIEYHLCGGGGSCPGRDEGGRPGFCGGAVLFDLPEIRAKFPTRDVWTVDQWEPLTLSPSLLCGCKGCGHHGWIRDGRWVPA